MGHHSIKRLNNKSNESTKEKLKRRKKESKLKLKEKRARLIVRNLPFNITEENLREHFEKFGEIQNVQILKKEDGKALGCGFIQFKLVQKAAKAQYHTNGKPFFGREINVDFALPKNKYQKIKDNKSELDENITIKEEPMDSDEIKQEGENNNDSVEIKEESEIIQNEKELNNEQYSSNEEDSDGDNTEEDDDNDDNDISDNENDDSDLEKDRKNDIEDTKTETKPRIISNDVSEGKTVFVKNVPFMATNDDLRKCFNQFGPLVYALVCIDKKTEHSKGTAFVKFRNKEDAEKALKAGTELTLMGNILDPHKALNRNEINKNPIKQPKDNRNLYLVKEGVILAGTKAAEGVSESDMAKRLQIENYKTKVLRNLNMYVSRERIIIYNLPPTWDNEKLKLLIQKYSNKFTIIKEARVIKDKNGISKNYGFVTFSKHEDALNVLRTLNNNPNVFSKSHRPIVTFAIENKTVIKNKLKRLEKSQRNNPNCKSYVPNTNKIEKNKNDEKNKKRKKPQLENENVEENNDKNKKFSGLEAKPGVQKLRSRYKLNTQIKLHRENLKKEKKKLKSTKKSLKEKKQDFIRQDKQKINKSKLDNDDDFSKIVNNYKNKLAASSIIKKKWYE